MKFKIETKTLNHKHKMKNLFTFAIVALALTSFTACNNEEAATETEAVETEVVEETPVVEEEVVVDSAAMTTDSTTIVE
ncbi:hypothetical protein [Pontibacter oryzae]|uniref:Uncharacterized protein n=1 Tax=Pontibacter oryzae TaxID=2304593 RepID=A0A399SJ36_9BACT|nr:hypothetical protein [Pontibacter oryzae]RIJ42919.1 hypothetical protein D1627_03505 [Pontibacter oryzae]